MQRGNVFHIQRFSLHDGPGIRTTVFLKGCPLSCRWCHNPESQSPDPEIRVLEHRCAHCGQCVERCPNSDSWHNGTTASVCVRCGQCVDVCPTTARQMVGRRLTPSEVLEEVLRDRQFFDESQGGVTFSGGEPLMQPTFLRALLQACHAESLHTALDTCGHAAQPLLLEMAALADLVLYDLKTLDSAVHQEQTGVPNEQILDNLVALGKIHNQIWIRVPLVPQVDLTPEALEMMARFVANIPGVQQVNLLPYHDLGAHKRRQMQDASAVVHAEHERPKTVKMNRETHGVPELAKATSTAEQGAEYISELRLDTAAAIFRAVGLKTIIGG